MKIAIASGKGGTGKTTVSVNLYQFLSKEFDNQVQLIDCDVEEPNAALFFADLQKNNAEEVHSLVPKIDNQQCNYCKKCVEWCEFNAISIVERLNFTNVNYELCHSCGACVAACKFNAITEVQKPLGTLTNFTTGFGIGLSEGRLVIGSAMQTSLIKELKTHTSSDAVITLFDAPPGTSCPVVETVADADYVLVISEPTPFGLNDFKITVELLQEMAIPFGVIINKAGLGNNEIHEYLHENGIDLLAEIPFSKAYAKQYSKGELLKSIPEEIAFTYKQIVEKIKHKMPGE